MDFCGKNGVCEGLLQRRSSCLLSHPSVSYLLCPWFQWTMPSNSFPIPFHFGLGFLLNAVYFCLMSKVSIFSFPWKCLHIPSLSTATKEHLWWGSSASDIILTSSSVSTPAPRTVTEENYEFSAHNPRLLFVTWLASQAALSVIDQSLSLRSHTEF